MQCDGYLNGTLCFLLSAVEGSDSGSGLSDKFNSMDLNPPKNHATIKHYQRRNRTKFTSEQTLEMEKAYERTQYPDALTREELAERLNISESRIQVMGLSLLY